MMMMMMMLMMIVSFFFNESLLAICFVLSSHWLCPWGPKASRNEAQMRQAVDPVATNEATDGDVDLPNREKHHGVDQKSPGTILVAGSSRWPFQASIQGHFTPKKRSLNHLKWVTLKILVYIRWDWCPFFRRCVSNIDKYLLEMKYPQ